MVKKWIFCLIVCKFFLEHVKKRWGIYRVLSFKMSVFASESDPLEKRVKILEKKVRDLEKLLGKKPTKETDVGEKEEEEVCLIS